METGQCFGCVCESGAVRWKSGNGRDAAALVFKEVEEGLFCCFADWFEGVGEGEFDVAGCGVDAMGDVGYYFDDFVGEETVGC